MTKDGYAESTIQLTHTALRTLNLRGANLLDFESVKEVISKQPWSQNRKRNVINAYTQFLKFLGRSWEAPICSLVRKLPFIPTTEEVNNLIAGCSVPVATFLNSFLKLRCDAEKQSVCNGQKLTLKRTSSR